MYLQFHLSCHAFYISNRPLKDFNIYISYFKNWTLETTNGSTASVWIAEGTTLYPGAYITISPAYRWIDNICGIQRVRLVGIDAPEIGEEGYEEANEFLNKTCMWEEVMLDVDDEKQYDSYYRMLAVVYVKLGEEVLCILPIK